MKTSVAEAPQGGERRTKTHKAKIKNKLNLRPEKNRVGRDSKEWISRGIFEIPVSGGQVAHSLFVFEGLFYPCGVGHDSFLYLAIGVARNVAANVHRNGQPRNVGGGLLDVHRKAGLGAAEALWSDAQ